MGAYIPCRRGRLHRAAGRLELSPIVIGSGRLQFHSAPDSACPMKGVFIIPKEEVIAYVQMRDGWSSIMYLNPRTSNDISGWVRSARLRTVGTMGPKR